MRQWGGRAAQRLTAQCLAAKGTLCTLRLPGCTRVATTADHIIARKRGGPDELWNLTPACSHCNSSKGARPVHALNRVVRPTPARRW
ncbi:hypothetical protein GCM10027289_30120 [Tsukamurella serpentis]